MVVVSHECFNESDNLTLMSFLNFFYLWKCVFKHKVKLNVADSWLWRGSVKGHFSTK